MTVVRKLINISNVDVPIQTDGSTTVFIHPNQTLEHIEVHNLENVRKFLKIEQDLGEINPIKESRIKLYD